MNDSTDITKEMCDRGFTDEQFSIDLPMDKDDPKLFVRLVGEVGGPYCGGRHGNSVYLESIHNDRAIEATVQTVFDHQPPFDVTYTISARSRQHIGCSQWTPDIGHVQYYMRKITRAVFVS